MEQFGPGPRVQLYEEVHVDEASDMQMKSGFLAVYVVGLAVIGTLCLAFPNESDVKAFFVLWLVVGGCLTAIVGHAPPGEMEQRKVVGEPGQKRPEALGDPQHRDLKSGDVAGPANACISEDSVDDPVRCPECGSSQIHAEKRGWTIMTGALYSNNIVLTCLKCAHKFKPGKPVPWWQFDPRG